MHHGAWGLLAQLHLLLALVIAAAYLSVPFTALRRLAELLPKTAVVSGSMFFLTCAITHLGIAAGFHESHWMVLNDFVQAVSVITFIASLSRVVSRAMHRRSERLAKKLP